MKRMTGRTHLLLVILCLAMTASPSAAADEASATPPVVHLSLNSHAPVEAGGCRLTFVIRNLLGVDIEQMVAETVLFDRAGSVAALTLFDFGALPEGRPRVRQFDVTNVACDGIGQVLVNGVGTCSGTGLTPERCLDGLRLDSRTDIEVLG